MAAVVALLLCMLLLWLMMITTFLLMIMAYSMVAPAHQQTRCATVTETVRMSYASASLASSCERVASLSPLPLQRYAMLLRDIWIVAAEGRLSAREQCKLWALRHVLQLLGKDEAQYDWMSKQVLVEGGTHIQAGRRFGNSPSASMVLVKVGTPGTLPGSEAALHP